MFLPLLSDRNTEMPLMPLRIFPDMHVRTFTFRICISTTSELLLLAVGLSLHWETIEIRIIKRGKRQFAIIRCRCNHPHPNLLSGQ